MTETTELGAAEARYREMARERRALGERAEREVAALLGTLGEIRDLDGRQREEARRAGAQDHLDQTPAGTLLGGWLANRLGGPGGYAGLVRGLDADKALPDLDPLASK